MLFTPFGPNEITSYDNPAGIMLLDCTEKTLWGAYFYNGAYLAAMSGTPSYFTITVAEKNVKWYVNPPGGSKAASMQGNSSNATYKYIVVGH